MVNRILFFSFLIKTDPKLSFSLDFTSKEYGGTEDAAAILWQMLGNCQKKRLFKDLLVYFLSYFTDVGSRHTNTRRVHTYFEISLEN